MYTTGIFVLLFCVYSFPEGTAKDLLKSRHLVCTAITGHDLNSLIETLGREGEKPNKHIYV